MRTAGMVLALAALVPTFSACSRHTPPDTSGGSPPDPTAEVALRVVNHHWLDVTIYAIHSGERNRVGVVGATTSVTLLLPPYLLGPGREIRLLADPIGARGVATTETLVVQPGQYIEWILERGLSRSSVAVY